MDGATGFPFVSPDGTPPLTAEQQRYCELTEVIFSSQQQQHADADELVVPSAGPPS
jgi:hypothetical protein